MSHLTPLKFAVYEQTCCGPINPRVYLVGAIESFDTTDTYNLMLITDIDPEQVLIYRSTFNMVDHIPQRGAELVRWLSVIVDRLFDNDRARYTVISQIMTHIRHHFDSYHPVQGTNQ